MSESKVEIYTATKPAEQLYRENAKGNPTSFGRLYTTEDGLFLGTVKSNVIYFNDKDEFDGWLEQEGITLCNAPKKEKTEGVNNKKPY